MRLLKTLFGCIAGVGAIACLAFAQVHTPTTWKSFTGNTGFSVRYPNSWVRKGISNDSLTILSSKGGAEGVIIKKGQAMISVGEASEHASSSLSRAIKYYTQDEDIISKRDIANDDIVDRGCDDLHEVISKEGIVPPQDVLGHVPYVVNTEFFCKANGHVYVTVLRNFEGDKKQAAYQQIALQVARSLRIHE